MLSQRARPNPRYKHVKSEEPSGIPGAVLDARMYPHIVDMIVQNAPHGSLIRLRAVCRMLRDQCDGLLARHLVMAPRHILPTASPVVGEQQAFSAVDVGVEEEEEEEWDEFADPPEPVLPPVLTPPPTDTREFKVSITSPYGRIPLFRAWQQALWKDTGAEVDDMSLSCESKLRAVLSLRGTKILDIIGAIIDPRPAIILQLIGQPITLRLRRDETGIAPQMAAGAALPADFDAVKIYGLAIRHVNMVVLFCDLWDTLHPALQHPDVSHPSITQSKQVMRRIVINAHFDPDLLAIPPDLNDAEYPLSVNEIVFIFRAKSGYRPRGFVRATHEEISRYVEILFETMGFYLTDMHHTIVNITDLNSQWMGAAEGETLSATDMEHRIRSTIRKDLALRDENPDEVLARQLRFVTLDEYRQEVGEERFRIEAMEEFGNEARSGTQLRPSRERNGTLDRDI